MIWIPEHKGTTHNDEVGKLEKEVKYNHTIRNTTQDQIYIIKNKEEINGKIYGIKQN